MPTFQHKLQLKEGDNPEYYRLFNKFHEFIDRYNLLQKRMQTIRPKVWYYRRSKKELDSIKPELGAYVLDYLKWRGQVDNFILEPNIIVTNEDVPGLAFLHFMDNLRDAKNHLENDVTIVEDNFRYVGTLVDSELNFGIAMTSFILTFLGLIVTLYALL